jgi:transcriptional regulator with XRE-family HTH domain
MTENKEVMARNIRYYMELNRVNSTEICKTLGFKQSTFSNWINAKIYPRIDKIEKMANYFGISKADLVEEQPRSFDSPEEFEKAWEEAGGAPHPTYTVSWPPQRPILSDHENKVIMAYRKAPESIQEAVDKLLDINRERKESASCG